MRGNRIKERRKAKGYTQAQLAHRAGVGLDTIRSFEITRRDFTKATVETAYRIAVALGCHIEDLME